VVVSLVAAVVAALCYGIASVMQAVAVRAASRRPSGGGPTGTALGSVDPGLVVRMLRQWRFVASLGLDLIGFLAQLVALRRLPLFAVQAMVAGSLAVTAVLAAWLINVQLAWREWLAVAGVVVGVGLLGGSAGAEGAKAVSGPFKLALIVAVAAVAVAGVLAARLPRPARTPVLGAVAGLGYGVVAVAARILPGYSLAELARDPAAYAAVAGGVVSFMLYAAALDNGSVTVATAAVVLAETAPPALVGILFLGDHTRPGLAPVAWVAFVLAVTSAVLLARIGEAGENAGGGPQAAGEDPHGGLTPDQDGEPSTSTVL
jgi:drug/metabolite transporter (DMT)-like permease